MERVEHDLTQRQQRSTERRLPVLVLQRVTAALFLRFHRTREAARGGAVTQEVMECHAMQQYGGYGGDGHHREVDAENDEEIVVAVDDGGRASGGAERKAAMQQQQPEGSTCRSTGQASCNIGGSSERMGSIPMVAVAC